MIEHTRRTGFRLPVGKINMFRVHSPLKAVFVAHISLFRARHVKYLFCDLVFLRQMSVCVFFTHSSLPACVNALIWLATLNHVKWLTVVQDVQIAKMSTKFKNFCVQISVFTNYCACWSHGPGGSWLGHLAKPIWRTSGPNNSHSFNRKLSSCSCPNNNTFSFMEPCMVCALALTTFLQNGWIHV